MGGSPGDVGEVPVMYVKQRKGCRMICDVDEATEGLDNELWRRWCDERVGEWGCDVGEATEGLDNELWPRGSDERVGEWVLLIRRLENELWRRWSNGRVG